MGEKLRAKDTVSCTDKDQELKSQLESPTASPCGSQENSPSSDSKDKMIAKLKENLAIRDNEVVTLRFQLNEIENDCKKATCYADRFDADKAYWNTVRAGPWVRWVSQDACAEGIVRIDL